MLPATVPAANGAVAGSLPIASLYVGDLSPDVTEAILFEKFSQIGPVLSIRVCRDVVTRRSLGYAYINFQSPADAERAMDTLNFEPIKGDKPMRLMWTQRDPSLRRSGVGNIFIKNLAKDIDNKAFYDTFGAFGKILSCKIVQDAKGNSLGYGFVHYEKSESAEQAIEQINGKLLNDKQVFVGPFIAKKERDRTFDGKRRFTNLYIKHIKEDVNEETLTQYFSRFGTICSVFLKRDSEGRSKKFGFVAFENSEDADKALMEMNDKESKDIDIVQENKKLYVQPAKKRADRQAEIKVKFDKIKAERANRFQDVNLYIKNLDEEIDDKLLRETFEQYGTVTSAKVMVGENNVPRGFGFVCFSTPDEATKAVSEMNGRILKSKPLYVALAQRKEDRQSQLSAMYSQRAIPGMRISAGGPPQIPAGVYPGPANAYYAMPGPVPQQRPYLPQFSGVRGPQPRWPAVAAQMRPGAQPTPGTGFIAAQPQFRGQQPRPSNIPNAMRPPFGQQQQQQSQRVSYQQLGGQMRLPSVNMPHPGIGAPSAVPVAQQGQPQRQNLKFNSNARNSGMDTSMAAKAASATQRPAALDPSELAKMNPTSQKQQLGEYLYPIISQLQGVDLAGRITGMLLELDNSDLLAMAEAHSTGADDLIKKAEEAVTVIRAHAAKEAAASMNSTVRPVETN